MRLPVESISYLKSSPHSLSRRVPSLRITRRFNSPLLFALVLLAPIALREGFSSPIAPGAQGPTVARNGMVATSNDHATLAALQTLQRGGNAIDAMAVAQFVLNVAEPYASGIGGGCFIMLYDASEGQVIAIDGREEAPADYHPEIFLDDTGEPVPFRQRITGGKPVGVPGTLAAMAYALEHHGTMSMAQTLQPAIDLAERGFPVDTHFAAGLRDHADRLRSFPASKELFFDKTGNPLQQGDLFQNPDLAETFRSIAAKGPDTFYAGEIGNDLVQATRNAPVAPGSMTADDLAGYRAVRRKPVTSTYRGYRLHGMNMPTSGPTSIMMMLNLLEAYDLPRLEHNEVRTLHALADAQNIVFADRNAYMADADFADVPLDTLLSTPYTRIRRKLLAPLEAAPTPVQPGFPNDVKGGNPSTKHPKNESTTHFCIVDKERNVVSITTTIEQHFGAGIVVPNRGFLLNNELTDFAAQPYDDAGNLVPNAPEGGKQLRRTALGDTSKTRGGKRPRSSMSPLLIMKDEAPYLAVGSPGGSRIIGITLNVILNHLDFEMNIQQAVNAPRLVARNGPVELEPRLYRETATRTGLQARGFDVKKAGPFGAAQAIRIAPDGRIYGAADPRRRGVALGY